MLSQSYTVIHPNGFHIRPSKVFVQAATKFPCQVHLIKGSKKINGKSSLGLMALGLAKGNEVILEVDGEREDEALLELGTLLTRIYEE